MLLLLATLIAAFSGCAYTAPWRQVATSSATGKAMVVVTAVEIKWGQRTAFFQYTKQVLASMNSHEGLLGYSFRFQLVGNRAWTMTAWQDQASLGKFVRSTAHQTAVDEGSRTTDRMKFHTLELPVDSLPLPWAEAVQRVEAGRGVPSGGTRDESQEPLETRLEAESEHCRRPGPAHHAQIHGR